MVGMSETQDTGHRRHRIQRQGHRRQDGGTTKHRTQGKQETQEHRTNGIQDMGYWTRVSRRQNVGQRTQDTGYWEHRTQGTQGTQDKGNSGYGTQDTDTGRKGPAGGAKPAQLSWSWRRGEPQGLEPMFLLVFARHSLSSDLVISFYNI